MKKAYALLATTIISSAALHGVSISLTQFSNEMTQTSGEVSETLTISLPENFNHLGFFMAEDLHLDFSNSLSDRSLEGVHHARMLAEVIGIRPASDLLVKASRVGYIRGHGNNEPDPTRGREAPPPY